MKKFFTFFVLSALFVFILIFPVQTLEASRTGLLLWFDSLLPTLMPFLIISQLILKTSLIELIQKIFGLIFKYIFHCSENGSLCILCGFLCGYPVGARLIALQIKDKQLSVEEGQYLLSFCNNISPVFCISYGINHAIGSSVFLPYFLMIYGSAFIFGLLTRPAACFNKNFSAKKQTPLPENIFQLIDVCIIDSFLILIKLCGYLILFSIINKGILMMMSNDKPYAAAFIHSILEITGGLSALSKLPFGTIRTAIGIAALTFGGICCIFQTNSVINDTGLSLGKYILHKLWITLLALLLFFLWCFFYRFTIN